MANTGLVTSATNPGPVRGSAVVEITDTLPPDPPAPPAPAPAAWWMDPLKLGAAVLGGVVLLLLLLPPKE